jgi:pimeloyl-ACP methyl ester carboxylesterase
MQRLAKARFTALNIGLIGILCASAASQTDSLPRRGALGVGLGVDEAGAVRVTTVQDNSTAADLGVMPKDVIQSIDSVTTKTPADVIAAVGKHVHGRNIAIDIVRDGRLQHLDGMLKPLLQERLEGAEMEYGSVVASGARLRTIVSVPANLAGRAPAVLLIPGGGCGSIDTPLFPDLAQPGLMRVIGRNGFVTMRVDKSGVGDSEGPPCDSIGYEQELSGYRAALRALTSHRAVDPKRVFLLGISLGGVFAPVLANETAVAGIVAYGTIATAPGPYPGRAERFFREFASIDIPAAWAKVNAPVLVMHGTYDETTSAEAHETIARIVNTAHPGLAEHREFDRLDHCWSRHATLEASRENCGRGAETTDLSAAILAFLNARS